MIKSINSSTSFIRQFKRITKNNIRLRNEIIETIELLKIDPFSSILKSHKVNATIGGTRWSSRVTGDVRIIWDFNNDDIHIIELLDVGGHSGSNKVYK